MASYTEKERMLSEYIDNTSDVQILLDAHDLALELKIVLDFVTGDWRDIKGNDDYICSQINLRRIVFLAEFKSAS